MTSVVMPGLPLSQLNIQRSSPSEDIAAETGWIIGEIVDGLTTDPEQLREIFHEKFPVGNHKICTSVAGELRIWSPRRLSTPGKGLPTALVDPADYAIELYETLCDSGMCDGLPLIPPTCPRVEIMLAFTDRLAEEY
jgi:hypothetical protein